MRFISTGHISIMDMLFLMAISEGNLAKQVISRSEMHQREGLDAPEILVMAIYQHRDCVVLEGERY